jgi:Protein of unknown function (DUF664)
VTDHKPPRAFGELEILRSAWQFQRDSIVRKARGVSEADADRALVDSGTTLRWLVQHACYAERVWVRIRFAGDDGALEGVDGDVVVAASLAEAIEAYEAEWLIIDDIVDAHALDDEVPDTEVSNTSPITLRWIAVHLIEELARHAGHADILRELLDGDTGR